MRHADLATSTQYFMVGLLAVVLVAVLTRTAVFLRAEYSERKPSYPRTWTARQCRVLEVFRVLLGIALLLLWLSFVLLAPAMPTNWPFGYLETISLIVLIALSHAWVVLLTPRNWEKFGAFSHSFGLTLSFLLLWWATMFGATGWMLAKASASPPPALPALTIAAAEPFPYA